VDNEQKDKAPLIEMKRGTRNYQRDIKLDIELKIIVGEYAVGSRFPSISAIAKIYGVGTSTTQKALETLCSEGVIYNQKGIGYFVRPYMREKLKAAHIKELRERLESVAEYGLRLGVKKDDLIEFLVLAYDNASSSK